MARWAKGRSFRSIWTFVRRIWLLSGFSIVLVSIGGCSKKSAEPDEPERYEEWLNYPDCSWGPDSSVYFTYIGDTAGNAAGIYRIPISGQGLPEYVGPYGGPHFPSTRVSPCGDRLAYVYVRSPGYGSIWIKDLTQPRVADGKATRIKDAFVGEISWLGCDTILYNIGGPNTWMLDIATGEDKELYPWGFDFISTSRRGEVIAISDFKTLSTISLGLLDTLVHASASDPADWIGGVRVAPDGRTIAFDHYAQPKAGNWWGMNVEAVDSKTGVIVTSMSLARHPTYTADGQIVYVSLFPHNLYQLWLQDRRGNRRMLISRFQFPGVTH